MRDERDGKVEEKSRLVLDRCGDTAIKIIVFFKKNIINQNLNFENVILCSALSLNQASCRAFTPIHLYF